MNKAPVSKSLDVSSKCLLFLTAFALTVSLMYLKAVMVPFVLAVFLYFMVSPCVGIFEKGLKIPRILSVFLTLFLAVLFTSVMILFLSKSLSGFLKGAEEYQAQILQSVAWMSSQMSNYGLNLDIEMLQDELDPAKALVFMRQLGGQFMGIIGNFVLILIFLMFLLLGEASGKSLPPVVGEISSKVTRYIWTKFTMSLATGLMVGLVLSLVGLDLAFMFAVLVFLLNFIPSVGSIIATVLPLPVALLQFGVGWQFFVILSIPGLVQFSIGNVIEPKVMGQSLGLHPITILLFLLFWGAVWGIPGMFLAVPITAIVKVVAEQFPASHRLARLLEGQLS